MATKGGSGTFLPAPGDENVAPVIPLRQRQNQPPAAPTPRKPLPRERAAFDPELEPADVALRRRRPPRAALGRVRQAAARLHTGPARMAAVGVLAAMATVGVLAVVILAQPLTSSGARRASTAALRAGREDAQTQMSEATADRSRYLLTNKTPAADDAPNKHDRTRTRKDVKRVATTARHRSHPRGPSTPTRVAARSREPVTGGASGLSGTHSSPASSSGSGINSDSGSTGASSASNGSTAPESPRLPPGPTGVGSANGCNPKCS
jgi:hypothetical protein